MIQASKQLAKMNFDLGMAKQNAKLNLKKLLFNFEYLFYFQIKLNNKLETEELKFPKPTIVPKIRVEILHGTNYKPVTLYYQLNPILNHPIDEIIDHL